MPLEKTNRITLISSGSTDDWTFLGSDNQRATEPGTSLMAYIVYLGNSSTSVTRQTLPAGEVIIRRRLQSTHSGNYYKYWSSDGCGYASVEGTSANFSVSYGGDFGDTVQLHLDWCYDGASSPSWFRLDESGVITWVHATTKIKNTVAKTSYIYDICFEPSRSTTDLMSGRENIVCLVKYDGTFIPIKPGCPSYTNPYSKTQFTLRSQAVFYTDQQGSTLSIPDNVWIDYTPHEEGGPPSPVSQSFNVVGQVLAVTGLRAGLVRHINNLIVISNFSKMQVDLEGNTSQIPVADLTDADSGYRYLSAANILLSTPQGTVRMSQAVGGMYSVSATSLGDIVHSLTGEGDDSSISLSSHCKTVTISDGGVTGHQHGSFDAITNTAVLLQFCDSMDETIVEVSLPMAGGVNIWLGRYLIYGTIALSV